MTDEELCDALVEAGILRRICWRLYNKELNQYWLDADRMLAREALDDWRVAGACLERIDPDKLTLWLYKRNDKGELPVNHLSPRAIITAFVESRK